MKLGRFLARLDRRSIAGAPATAHDRSLSVLQRRLDEGYTVASAIPDLAGFGTVSSPCLLLALDRRGEREDLLVWLGERSIRFLQERLSDVEVSGTGPGPDPAAPGDPAASARPLACELAALFESTRTEPPERRAAALMDWIMERIEAARCALIPFESSTPGPALAFRRRTVAPGDLDPRKVPRRVIDQVARTRQPLLSHDVGGKEDSVPPSESTIRQGVRAYMAVPVVFRGELLAVCYVDRFGQPRRFSADEQAAFSALAYELALPLLELRAQMRAEEFRELRDALLYADDPPPAPGPALARVRLRARELAPHVEENLIILGETGVGKEVLAREVHEASGRRGRFIACNVSALQSELFESELMGSVRGAFTGAVDRAGLISQAEGGTLFLDEIGDLPLVNQVKLLRFLQDRRVRPVGGRGERESDTRVVAATNRALDAMVDRGEFRADLLHRFAPPLVVPPLRERREEILPHARRWIAARARQKGLRATALTADAEAYLIAHPWPGNFRQLEAVLSSALLQSGGRAIDRATVESLIGPATAPPAPQMTWPEWQENQDREERRWLIGALERQGGNVAATARHLRCARSTLRSLLKKHGVKLDDRAEG